MNIFPNLLVNNVSPRKKIQPFCESEEDWRLITGGAFESLFTYSRELLDNSFPDARISIINISSVNATLIGEQPASYHVAKAGVDTLTKYFAVHGRKKDPT
jgi:3-oxoacyl-[acyl-carrier protein] reductase